MATEYLKTLYLDYRACGYAAPEALERARRTIARDGQSAHFGRWTSCAGPKNPNTYGEKYRLLFVEKPATLGLRAVNYADSISGHIRHTGWFTAEDGEFGTKFRGMVWQVPAKRGKARYVSGYEDTDSGAYLISTAEINDTEIEAAHSADELARIMAENAREWDSAWRAGTRYANNAEALADELAMLPELIKAPDNAACRKMWSATIRKAREIRETMRELWADCPSYLEDAFREGANGHADNL